MDRATGLDVGWGIVVIPGLVGRWVCQPTSGQAALGATMPSPLKRSPAVLANPISGAVQGAFKRVAIDGPRSGCAAAGPYLAPRSKLSISVPLFTRHERH